MFEDHRAFESRRVSNLENRRFAEWRDRKEPVRLSGEIDVDAREGQRFLSERDRHALHVGASLWLISVSFVEGSFAIKAVSYIHAIAST